MLQRKLLTLLLFFYAISIGFGQIDPLPKATPEELGISSEGIHDLITAWENEIEAVHSFMLLRNGKVVAEGWWKPYKKEDPHVLFSLSKSFTSAAIGIAENEGLLSVDEVVSFFPDDLPENPSDYLKAMRVKDLLTMSTGQRTDTYGAMATAKDNNRVKTFLALPVEQKPGTLFIYNTGATYILSAILQKVTGMKLVDYLQPRLFDPLGIIEPKWEEGPEGISFGGFGLFLPTEAIAKFGQLYLQKGVWNGKQLIPEEWILQSTSRQVSNGSDPTGNWDQGYGYQFWQNPKYGYRADGAFGQLCLVFPEQNMVLAATSGTKDMNNLMNLVWEKLMPAVKDEPLPENKIAQDNLKQKLNQLNVSPVAGIKAPSMESKVSGKTFHLEDNEQGISSIKLSFTKNNPYIEFAAEQENHIIYFGNGSWKYGETKFRKEDTFSTDDKHKIATSGGWISDDIFEIAISYHETQLITKLRFKFSGNIVIMEGERNVSFGPTKIPRIIGETSAKPKLATERVK
ncbi:hypothetical protein BH23BAC1_BH23BAC1_24460 [soil metagenome]